MTSANYNYFTRVTVFVNSPSGGLEFSFVNKSLKDYSSQHNHWPLLKSVSDITLAAGEYLPTQSFGSVTIDDSIGSLGANRKFSDVLQRYSPIEQYVTVYVSQTDVDVDSTTAWTQIAQGVCSSWSSSVDSTGATITFEVRTAIFKDKVVTMEVTTDVTGMTAAPTTSLGRTVPLLYGDSPDVVPIRISANGSTSPTWAIASCFYNFTENYVVSPQYYSKNYLDQWEQFFAGSPYDKTGDATGGQFALNAFASQAYAIDTVVPTAAYVATGLRFTAKGNGVALRVSTAQVEAVLLRYDFTTYQVVEVMAVGRTSLTAYDVSNNAGTNPFNVDISFDEPALMSAVEGRYGYAIGWSCTGWAANEMSFNYTSAASSIRRWVKDAADSSDVTTWKTATPLPLPKAKILSVTATTTAQVSSAYNQSGFGYSSVQFTQTTAGSGQVNPHFDNFPLVIANAEGPYPQGGSVDYRVDKVVELLDATYSGTWSASARWDRTRYTTAYSSQYVGSAHTLSRTIIGSFSERTTYTEFLTAVCRASLSRVGILSTGLLFMFPWGYNYTVAFNIPAGDIIPVSWDGQDISTVINSVNLRMFASPVYQARAFEGAATETDPVDGYVYSKNFDPATNTAVALLTADSRAGYGIRELGDNAFDFYTVGFGGLATTGGVVAQYYLSKYAKPLVYATFIVPYHRYSTIEMFDVITFSHPAFPAYYGTDPDASEPVYEDANTGTTNLIDGYEWVRAETYRGLVESKTYLLPENQAPAIRITVQVLLNSPADPT